MGWFTKPEYKDYMMRFKVLEPEEYDRQGCCINILAYGNVEGEDLYCFATYDLPFKYSVEIYEAMLVELYNSENKEIKVTIKFKNNKAKDFKIDLDSLALAYQDNRLSELELGGWGLHHNWPI